MKTILQGWNLMRAIRLIAGIAVLVQGIITKDAMTIILGTVFGGMAVANAGCCGAAGCAITPRRVTQNRTIQYEELDRN